MLIETCSSSTAIPLNVSRHAHTRARLVACRTAGASSRQPSNWPSALGEARHRLEGVAADVGDGDDDRDRGDLGGRVHGGLGCVGSLDERVARERARLDLGRRAILLLLVLLRVLLVALPQGNACKSAAEVVVCVVA
eukprot:3170453-Rhodomonas_salina.2